MVAMARPAVWSTQGRSTLPFTSPSSEGPQVEQLALRAKEMATNLGNEGSADDLTAEGKREHLWQHSSCHLVQSTGLSERPEEH